MAALQDIVDVVREVAAHFRDVGVQARLEAHVTPLGRYGDEEGGVGDGVFIHALLVDGVLIVRRRTQVLQPAGHFDRLNIRARDLEDFDFYVSHLDDIRG